MSSIVTDVLVVGGGGATARAVLEASMAGADVILAAKGSFGAVGVRGAGATASAISELGAIVAAGDAPPPLWSVDPDKDLADIL